MRAPSSAATAYREDVRRVGSDAHAQAAVQQTGVAIYDRMSGQMRSVTDIMYDMSLATRSLSEQERNRIIVQAFGARGLMAFGAVEKAQFTVMRDGVDVTLDMRATRERMMELARVVREGRRKGATARPLRSVINVGIGGSDLGPRLVCDALGATESAREGAPDVAFVSNVDPEHLTRALAGRDPAFSDAAECELGHTRVALRIGACAPRCSGFPLRIPRLPLS